MSIEVTLHPARASRDDLRKLLETQHFRPTGHLWDWPKGSLHYHWFEVEDYQSYDGVEATIYPPSDDKQLKHLGPCTWALHTRTRSSGSPADKQKQNDIVRLARQMFGGRFYNDWHGYNRYTPPYSDGRDARARGVYLAFEFVTQSISAVRFALPNPNQGLEKLVGTDTEPLASADPTRVLYNALVPFAVAALEHFFGQCFKTLLRYDASAKKRLAEQTRKVELADVLAIEARTKTIEDVVADWYSFQNISSIHKAFYEWFDIDVWSLLRRRKKIGKRIPVLERHLEDLIRFRHSVIHGLAINVELRKEQIQEILDLSRAVIDVFVDHLEKKYGKSMRD